MSRVADVFFLLACLLGALSAASLAGYVYEGLQDEFPRWILGLLAFAASLQLACGAWLAWRRSLAPALVFFAVSLGLAMVEFGTFSGVVFYRDFMSTAAACVVLVGIFANVVGQRVGPAENEYHDGDRGSSPTKATSHID